MMRMLKIKHLFWKIFFAFTLGNILVIAATTITVLKMTETRRFEEKQRELAEAFATKAIDFYEAGEQRKLAFLQRGKRRTQGEETGKHRHRSISPIKITNKNGEDIFNTIPSKIRRGPRILFAIESETGQSYTVEALIGPPPKIIEALHRLNTLQFIFVIIASALVSAVLSYIISRPINRLRDFSQFYTQHKHANALPTSLLTRGDEIGNLARDMHAMIHEIEFNLATQRQLLHDVSHELRAPLARLQVSANIIEKHNPDSGTHTQRINSECERMSALIQEILDYSRLDQQAYTAQKIDLGDFLKGIVNDIRYQHPNHPITLEIHEPKLQLQAYPELLERAITNVLLNSCKHTPEQTKISIDSGLDSNTKLLKLTIRDFGPGVAEEDRDKLFQLFYRANNQMHTQGFGLGLGICKRAIERHGGTITLENHPEGGLITYIFIPLTVAQTV